MEKNLVLLHRAFEEPEFQVPNPFSKGQQKLFSLALCKVQFFFRFDLVFMYQGYYRIIYLIFNSKLKR